MHWHPHKSQKDTLLWSSLSITEQQESFIFSFHWAEVTCLAWRGLWVIIQDHGRNALNDVLNQECRYQRFPIRKHTEFQILNWVFIHLFMSIHYLCLFWKLALPDASAAPVKSYFLTSWKHHQFIFSDAAASWDSSTVTVWWELVLSVVAEPEHAVRIKHTVSSFQVISVRLSLLFWKCFTLELHNHWSPCEKGDDRAWELIDSIKIK